MVGVVDSPIQIVNDYISSFGLLKRQTRDARVIHTPALDDVVHDRAIPTMLERDVVKDKGG